MANQTANNLRTMMTRPRTSKAAAASTRTTAKPMFQNGDLPAAHVMTRETIRVRAQAPTITISSVKAVKI